MERRAIKLTATSDFQTAGRQHVGRVTGPDLKFGTRLEFVGNKYGKRRDVTEVIVTRPGLYKVRDTTRKGDRDTYYLIWQVEGLLLQRRVTPEDATLLAEDLSPGSIEALGRRYEITAVEESLVESRALDPEGEVDVSAETAAKLELPAGPTRRADLVAARERWLHRLRAPRTAFTTSRAELLRRRDEIRAQLEPLERELAEVEAALAQET
jgi:hypothetical protein